MWLYGVVSGYACDYYLVHLLVDKNPPLLECSICKTKKWRWKIVNTHLLKSVVYSKHNFLSILKTIIWFVTNKYVASKEDDNTLTVKIW